MLNLEEEISSSFNFFCSMGKTHHTVETPIGINDDGSLQYGSVRQYGKEATSEELSKAADKQWEFALAQYQNQWNELHDSPAYQVQALIDAGLNPNLYDGYDSSGAASTNSSDGVRGSGTSEAQAFNQALSNAANGLNQGAQTALDINAQALQKEQIDLKRNEVALESKKVDNEIRKTDQDISESKSRINLNGAHVDEINQSIHESQQRIENLKKDGLLTDKKIADLDNQIKWRDLLNDPELKKSQKMLEMTDKQIELLGHEIENAIKKGENLDEEKLRTIAETTLTEKQVEYFGTDHGVQYVKAFGDLAKGAAVAYTGYIVGKASAALSKAKSATLNGLLGPVVNQTWLEQSLGNGVSYRNADIYDHSY